MTAPTYAAYVELDDAHLFDVCQHPWQNAGMPKTLPTGAMSPPVCCSPMAAGPLDDEAALEIALRLKALADPVRVKLVAPCCSCDAGQLCRCAVSQEDGAS